jgi:hypothetical protein
MQDILHNMSPGMAIFSEDIKGVDDIENQFLNGVKQLVDNGLRTVPKKYILPPSERPVKNTEDSNFAKQNLPIIDFSDLIGPNRPQVLQSLANACERYGFFQVSNQPQNLVIVKP